MSLIHLARQGFITKAALPSITRQRGTTTVESSVMLFGAGKTTVSNNTTFIDSGLNAFTVTRNGDTVQSGFNPFSGVSNGAGYFDGTGDYLSVANNANLQPGTSNFTIEAWVYRNAAGAAHTIYAKGGVSSGFVFQITSTNKLRFTDTTTNIDSTGSISATTWTHVAVVRSGTSTNQTTLYINGTADGQGTVATNFNQMTEVRVGTNRSATENFAGYITNCRFVNGTAVYTSNFTVPTSPLTAITNTRLLLLMDNYSVVNSTSSSLLVTVTGSAPISTAQYPSGMSSSIYFAGSGNSISLPATANFNFGTGDWTMEAYVYISADSPLDGLNRRLALICEILNNGGFYISGDSSVTGTGLSVYNATTGVGASVTTTISKTAWHHLAASKIGSTIYFFVDGTLISTGQSISGNWGTGSQTLRVGQVGAGSFSYPLNGYISNLRIIKGYGIYSSSFTPSAPLSVTATVPNYITNSIYGVYQLA